MMRLTAISLLFLALAPFAAAPAAAARLAQTDYARTEILAEFDAIAPGGELTFVIRQDVRPGWHVFWINPGDAGLPLMLDWRLPEGFSAGEIERPVPEFIPIDPLASYAFEDHAAYLVTVTAPADAEPGAVLPVSISASWQVCEEICVPEDAEFSFELTVSNAPQRLLQNAPDFAAARAAMPVKSDIAASIRAAGGKYLFEAAMPAEAIGENAFYFPAIEGLTTPSAPQDLIFEDGRLTIALEPGYLSQYAEETLPGVIGFDRADGSRAGIELTARVEGVLKPAAINAPAGPAQNTGLAALVGLAFFGGLILNVMPCVFPIIFVKAASLMQAAAKDRAAIRSHGLLYTAGVVASFVAVGALLLALRAGGEQLGWGFHLQSPAIVALSAYVLFLVGLNLFGLYHVAESFSGAGQSLAQKPGRAGAFFTGVLAVVVASPCIGPLLSAPMGAALVYPPLVGMLIFIALALGLAAPYLALSLAPGLGRYVPRPGPWMAVMKKTLAFPVFGAAAYFVWVLAQQTGPAALGGVLAGGVLLALAAWLFEMSKGAAPRDLVLRALAALAVVAAIAPLTRMEARAARAPAGGETLRYGALDGEPYSDALLQSYLSAGEPVFIDFTAAWCVTCQIDKLNVFGGSEMAAAFSQAGAHLLVADWTVRDPAITAALQRYGASGVPLYVFYGADGAARILPAPLTKKAVREALEAG